MIWSLGISTVPRVIWMGSMIIPGDSYSICLIWPSMTTADVTVMKMMIPTTAVGEMNKVVGHILEPPDWTICITSGWQFT